MEGLIQKPLSEFCRTTTRKAFEAVDVTQLRQMIVACFFPAGVSGEITRLDPDLGGQEPQYLDGDGLTRCKQPTRISQGTELEREAHFVVGATALFDLFKINVIECVVRLQSGWVSWQI